MGHTNISPKKWRQHLRICRERVKVTQSRLKPNDKRKVEGARGTTRVNGESYRQGEIYISSLHTELGQMEVCYYDARHYITNSSTKYHCRDCCARISKERSTIDNSESDRNHCWWNEMAETCPANHTPMEHHHLHGCVNYETKKPNVPRRRLTSELGLDSTSGTISIATSTAAVSTNYTSNSNTNSKREDADSEPPPIQIQPPTTPPGVPDPNPQHPTNTTNQAAEAVEEQLVGVQLPNQGGYALTHQYTSSHRSAK